MKLDSALFGKIFLILFVALFIQSIYKGIITPATEGDSVDYHIPIAKAYLKGTIMDSSKIEAPRLLRYYPANAEAILSGFLLLNIPLGLYNVLGIFVLFLVAIKLALTFRLNINLSVIFAVTICTLNGVMRWADTQIIDIWLLSFILIALIFLEKPKKTVSYFLLLGISFGLLIGTKYSAPFIALSLFVVYFKRLLPFLSLKKIIIFLLPIFILGFIWYIRNIIATGNPLYPKEFLFFKGEQTAILDTPVWKIFTGSIHGFVGTINAYISEYMVWTIIVPVTLISYLINKIKGIKVPKLPVRLLIVSFFITVFVINLPSSYETNIMTSSFRYFYGCMVPLILVAFIYWKEKAVVPLIILSMISILFVRFPMGYYPKLLLVAAPLAVFIYFIGYDYLVRKFTKGRI